MRETPFDSMSNNISLDLRLTTDLNESKVQSLVKDNPELTNLSLFDTYWLKYFTSLQQLSYVCLSPWSLDEITDLINLKSLRHLAIEGSILSNKFFSDLEKLTQITSLSLFDCENCNDQTVKSFTHLNDLELLDLYRPSITEEGVKIIASLKNLKTLRLTYSDITDRGFSHLKALKNLEELALVGNEITSEGIKNIKHFKNLKKLSFEGNITNEHLKQISLLTQLEELSLSGFPEFRDRGLSYLGSLKNLKRLELRLGTYITDEGLKELLQLSNLEYLKLSDGFLIKDKDLSFLNSLPKLKIINIK